MHPFFRTINWQDLYDKKIEPPYNPNVVSCSSFIYMYSFSLDRILLNVRSILNCVH